MCCNSSLSLFTTHTVLKLSKKNNTTPIAKWVVGAIILSYQPENTVTKLTKTEVKVLAMIEQAKAKGDNMIVTSGARECAAARKLVAKCLAGEYKSDSVHHVGESYYNHFTRSWTTYQSYTFIGGRLYF